MKIHTNIYIYLCIYIDYAYVYSNVPLLLANMCQTEIFF